jgi:hypothetical protein
MKSTRTPNVKSHMHFRITKEAKNVEVVRRDLGITKTTFHNWMKRYLGMDGEHPRRLRELKKENRKLKSM